MQQTRAYYLPAALIIVLTISFFRLDAFTLFDVDEAVFAEATREMVESGDWITPTYNGVNRYDKPILFYWLMALSFRTFGINEFSARFPSAAAGSLLCLLLYLFVRRNRDETSGLYAIISFAVSFYFVMYSHAAVTDMTLTLFISLSLFCLYHAVSGRPDLAGGTDWWLRGFYGFSALAFLTKGLIGILFPFGIAFVYLLLTSGIYGPLKVFSLPGVLLFLVLALPWYAAEYSVNGMDFINQFFIKHHFQRYTDIISGHKGAWYYYIPALIIGLSPWIIFLPEGIFSAWRQFRSSRQKGDQAEGASLLGFFALVWFLFIMLFFSFSTTKLPNYVLPALPAAAILIASGMAGQSEKQVRRSKILLALVSLAAGIGAVAAARYLPRFGIADTGWLFPLAAVLFSGFMLNVYGAVRKKSYHITGAVLTVLFLMLLSFKALPIASAYMQGTLHKYSMYVRSNLSKKGLLALYKFGNKPSIVFYSRHYVTGTDYAVFPAGGPGETVLFGGHSATRPEQMDQLDYLMKFRPEIMVISSARESQRLENKGLRLIEKDSAYALLERK